MRGVLLDPECTLRTDRGDVVDYKYFLPKTFVGNRVCFGPGMERRSYRLLAVI